MVRRLGKIVGYLALVLLLVLLLTYYSIINPLVDSVRDPLVRTVTKVISKSLHGTL